MITIETLKKFNIFSGLGDSELVKIAEICKERLYEDGSVIFTIGG